MMDPDRLNRAWGCALGAAIGDALGMALEFGPPRPAGDLVRTMLPGRLPAGTFTDDTEMALALAESLLAARPLNQADLAGRFLAWYRAGPSDIGVHTATVLGRVNRGETWKQAARAVALLTPQSAGNGSLMRCWPVALVPHAGLDALIDDSIRQSQVTHLHPECGAACALVNVTIFRLLQGVPPAGALGQALEAVDLPAPLAAVVEAAPGRTREQLANSGWVRHTLESAVWGLLTTATFAEAVIQVVNLGRDADTAGAVVGALAGAAYGLQAIPVAWQQALQGEWPLRSGRRLGAADLVDLADRLVGAG
ncbi:MAG TPA: ADP-ribosylglycohydrolase family protein [Anaerolineae bacterium]